MSAPSNCVSVIQPVIVRLDSGELVPLWKKEGRLVKTVGDKLLVEFSSGTFWIPKRMCSFE